MQKKLSPSNLQTAEAARFEWVATPEDGTPYEDILKPEYWSHVAKTLRPWHRIEVRAADASWMAMLLVRDAGPMWAKVHELERYELGARKVEVTTFEHDDYTVEHRGGAKWRVVRKADKEVMIQGLSVKADAEDWLRRHVSKLAA